MDLLVGEPWPSAAALQQEWLHNLARRQEVRQALLLQQQMGLLTAEVPESFYQLLTLHPWQWWRRRRAGRHYASLHLFVWQQALQETQPLYAAGLLRLLRHSLLQSDRAGAKMVARLERHLALYAWLSDNIREEGFLRIAQYVLQDIFGDIRKQPMRLPTAVQLADYLDHYFESEYRHLQALEIIR
ncbi:hypothetical protein [Candidatus Magnetaquicoccus inordinatus]|uniref:hypothetical protein n=1 Tax=Candidatus Magnetaquicoccus inordinatus TaxID=2496818 RepID=UPI00102CC493|nr:hypothetical protein [Candidatus Magnetaquicoccus inordinatus]